MHVYHSNHALPTWVSWAHSEITTQAKKVIMTQTNNKILVVGATGTVGSELVKLLVASGETVKAATRNPNHDLGPGVDPVLYDFDDPRTFDGALKDVDRVFYLSRTADPLAAVVAEPLFEKAADLGVKHIVNMSALGVEADDRISLRQVELLIEQSGIHFTTLRPNWFMQNFVSGFINDMLREKNALYIPAGDSAVSFIDVRDIAAVAAKILTTKGHENKIYALTGGEAFTHDQVVEKLADVTKRDLTYAAIGEDDMRAALKAQGLPDAPIAFMVGLFSRLRDGLNAPVSTDVEQILGHTPRTLANFVQEFSGSF